MGREILRLRIRARRGVLSIAAGHAQPRGHPTNLLYNVVATPGALYRYWRQDQASDRLALVLIAGTLPGVVAG